MSRAAELIEALRAEATVVDEGAFSIDEKRALEKLRQFTFGQPMDFGFHLVEALKRLGTARINVQAPGSDLILGFDPPDCVRQHDLSRLMNLSAGADDGRNDGLRALGLAVVAALRTSQRVTVQVRDGDAGWAATYQVDGEVELLRTPAPTWGRIVVDRGWGGFSKGLDLLGIRQRGAWCPGLIQDGRAIGRDPRDVLLRCTETHIRGLPTVAGFLPTPEAVDDIHILVSGVLFHAGHVDDVGPSRWTCFVDGSSLQRDATRTNFVDTDGLVPLWRELITLRNQMMRWDSDSLRS